MTIPFSSNNNKLINLIKNFISIFFYVKLRFFLIYKENFSSYVHFCIALETFLQRTIIYQVYVYILNYFSSRKIISLRFAQQMFRKIQIRSEQPIQVCPSTEHSNIAAQYFSIFFTLRSVILSAEFVQREHIYLKKIQENDNINQIFFITIIIFPFISNGEKMYSFL